MPKTYQAAWASRLHDAANRLEQLDREYRERLVAGGCDSDQLPQLLAQGAALDTLAALDLGLIDTVIGYPALSAAAARRRGHRAQVRDPRRWGHAEYMAAAARGLAGRPLGIAPAALHQLLRS